MLIVSLIIFVLIASYVVMLWRFAKGWKSLSTRENEAEPVSVAVIVPARNEEANIRACLTDLLRQDYPQEFLHIIMVDDGSEDGTAAIADELAAIHPQLNVMRAVGTGGKKQALQQGIHATHTQLIATVDADCRISPTWLSTMVAAQQQEGAKMVLGPVVLTPASNLFERIQRLEFLAIMGITGGSAAMGHPVMANGANLLFDRNAFTEAGGYSGSENPSGDDVFLMLKMKEKADTNYESVRISELRISESANGSQRDGTDAFPLEKGVSATGGRGIVFVKDPSALVSTKALPTFTEFWQQRKRWLSKKGGYEDLHLKTTAILTYLANLGGLVALVTSIFIFPSEAADLLLTALLIKSVADLLFIRMVARSLMPTCGLWDILPAQLFILIYVSSIGLFGNVRNYHWKGRNILVSE
jgi:cellulose synthase/poly-beta-1,6-N-acetylglucosamine synthase-like glycosyltransferase